MSKKYYPWLIWLPVLVLPLIAWFQSGYNLSTITVYSLFPILGIWAWGTMWTHYIIGGIRLAFPVIPKNITYSTVTEVFVLLCILLHPGLLAWKLAELGKGFPPGSYYNYVGSSLKLFIMFGALSLALFLSYDLLKKYKSSTFVRNNWKWVSLSQMLAMALIFIHSLKLGQNLKSGWMQILWLVMGALLIPSFALKIQHEWTNQDKKAELP